ncbi:MAG: twin-arginine translocation signal domain-containing protein, partial [Pirellula sp.]
MTNQRSSHCRRYTRPTSRRDFLAQAGAGMGLMAMADLLAADEKSGLLLMDDPLAPRPPHF